VIFEISRGFNLLFHKRLLPSRAFDKLAAAIRASSIHLARARKTERTLVRTDERRAVLGERATASFANDSHL
jgi:hypothetical protein